MVLIPSLFLPKNESLVKVFTKNYTISTGDTIDPVSGRYSGFVNIEKDQPTGTILAKIPIILAHPAYARCDATVGINGTDLYVNHKNKNEPIEVNLIWLYM